MRNTAQCGVDGCWGGMARRVAVAYVAVALGMASACGGSEEQEPGDDTGAGEVTDGDVAVSDTTDDAAADVADGDTGADADDGVSPDVDEPDATQLTDTVGDDVVVPPDSADGADGDDGDVASDAGDDLDSGDGDPADTRPDGDPADTPDGDESVDATDTADVADTTSALVPCPVERQRGAGDFGELVVTTDAELAELTGICGVVGALVISGSEVTSLAPLADLTFVTGPLEIQSTSLVNLGGLESLRLFGVQALEGGGLSASTGLSGIDISRNPLLVTLEGLGAVAFFDGYVDISQNAVLTNLSALSPITELNNGLSVVANASLRSLEGLHNVARISSLRLLNNPVLEDLQGLRGWRTDVAPFPFVEVIGNASLTDMQGLENLTGLRQLEVRDNDALVSLDGLESLGLIVSDLVIREHALLDDLTALGALTSITGTLEVSDNLALASLEGLHNVSGPTDVSILRNAALLDLQGLRGLTGSPAATWLIVRNGALVSLDGLQGVTQMTSLTIEDNTVLSSLLGLNELLSVDERIFIRSNPSLASITDLEALTSVGLQLTVNQHPLLPQCQVDALAIQVGRTCTTCVSNNGTAPCE